MGIKDNFSHMNNMQQKAVFCTEGPLLILAGAGSGKTTVLVNRIAYILQSGLCQPWQILAITFTNKAAGELKERICNAVPEGGNEIWAATFHSTCARILRRYGDRIGYSSHFTVYDTADQKSLIKKAMAQLNIDEKHLPVKSVIAEISKAKDKMQSPEDMLKKVDGDFRKEKIAKIYQIYQSELKNSDAMDFDDMLCNTVLLFEQNEDVLSYYQNLFKYIMVDEYQDTNKVQYKFVSMLAAKSGNICVVGDDDQSIYKFRGATIENILSFEKQFKNAQVIRLEQNYRSTKTILNAANKVIENNTARKGKTLWTENDSGEKITVHTAYSEREEASYIAQQILNGVADGRNFSDYAVLYRMNAQSNAIENAFSRSGIPHRIIGGHRFYDREEIKDMTAYLRVLDNPHDNVRLNRIINVPKRGIGKTTMDRAGEIAVVNNISVYDVIKNAENYTELSRASSKLKDFVSLVDGLREAHESGDYSLAELYELILEHTDYKNYLKAEKENADVRIENIEELKSNIIKFEEEYGDEATLSAFLEEISLQTDIDNYDETSDTTVMMTLHSAKGLEFPVVFIAGMEEGVFPGISVYSNPDELNEERRLAYVGITRAKEQLIITKTKSRMLFGSTTHNAPSRFVQEIPDELRKSTGETVFGNFPKGSSSFNSEKIEIGTNPSQYTFNPKLSPSFQKPIQKSTNTYAVGDSVLHKVFGKGMIIKAEKMGNDTMLEIVFETKGTKTLMANFCKMEKI
ncbi:MAG: UvrD-helicase domain-containing protein [Ruminococcus sp.]|nr:UvrD-helicase domain-containing protein [Ruminococcus sp.]